MLKIKLEDLILEAKCALNRGKKAIRIIPNGESTNYLLEELTKENIPHYIFQEHSQEQNLRDETDYPIDLTQIEIDDQAPISIAYSKLRKMYS